MATIRISEAEAIRDIRGLIARAYLGEEIVIEKDAAPALVLHKADRLRRSVSESIALAEARSRELGYKPVMDAGFASDLRDILASRKPRDTSAWD